MVAASGHSAGVPTADGSSGMTNSSGSLGGTTMVTHTLAAPPLLTSCTSTQNSVVPEKPSVGVNT